MPITIQPPISLTILRRGDMLLVDVAEVGSLIPRSETQVDDAFLQELAAEVSQLATPGYGRNRAHPETAVPPVREPERVVQELQRIGGLIFSHLLTEPVRTRLLTAEPCDVYLRLDEHVIQVPWELGFDGEHFLATKFRIGRQVITGYPLPAPRAARVRPDTLKVLLIADPTQSLPQARAEAEQLYALLGGMAGVNVTLLGGKIVRKLPLLAALQNYEVVHFAGHSEYDPATPHKSGWRLHEGILTAAELSKLTRPPQLVFSNSCQAGTTAAWAGGYRYEGQAFGIGSAFLLAGVPNYIGTFWEVPDEESVGFAVTFYRSLAAGQTLGGALHEARQATLTQSKGQGLTWASYMLYGNPATSLLPERNARPHPVLASAGSETVTPPGQPHSIPILADARELLQSQTEAHAEKSAEVSAHMARKLAAILSADVAGYSRLMGDDEEATIRTLAAYQGVMRHLIQQHRGRVVDAPGDNMLAEFASVVDAVRCAVEIQRELHTRNEKLPPTRQMASRIGINLGDVIVDGEKLYGDGVNIAARLEALAELGGICISGTVYDQVENKLALGYEYIGEQVVKNIAKPVRVYRVREAPRMPTAPVVEKKRNIAPRYQRWAAWAVAALLLLGGGIWAIQGLFSGVHDSLVTLISERSLPLPDKPSVVVLPFVNMSNDPAQEYFSDGLTEELTSTLAQLSSLFVIARNSAFTYKGKAVKVQDVSKELGVRYVLEGSVRKANNQVRITAQLIDGTTGGHLWSERYERPLQDIFAMQDEIVQKVALTLKLQLTMWERGEQLGKTTPNLDAYDYYLRGREAYLRVTYEAKKEANEQARGFFEQALAHDSAYGDAYIFLGWTYWFDWYYQWGSEASQSLQRAEELAKKAIALNDTQPWAYQLLSNVYLWEKQHDRALVEGRRALALKPNDSDCNLQLGWVLTFAGQPEEGSKWMEKAVRLNPLQGWYLHMLGWAYGMAGKYEECIPLLKRVLSLNPDYVPAHVILAMCYADAGHEEEARTEGAEVLRVIPQYSLEVWKQKWPYKDPAMLERKLAALRQAGLK